MSQRLTITLPDDVYNHIKEQADRDLRTIGAEITYLLRLHAPGYQDTTDYPSHTDHPYTGIRTPENPEGRPTLTNDMSSYYNNSHRKSIIN